MRQPGELSKAKLEQFVHALLQELFYTDGRLDLDVLINGEITPGKEWDSGTLGEIGCLVEKYGLMDTHIVQEKEPDKLEISDLPEGLSLHRGMEQVMFMAWTDLPFPDKFYTVEGLMEMVRRVCRGEDDHDALDDDHAKLERWARTCRPGDVVDGHWKVVWIVAVRRDARNDVGDFADIDCRDYDETYRR